MFTFEEAGSGHDVAKTCEEVHAEERRSWRAAATRGCHASGQQVLVSPRRMLRIQHSSPKPTSDSRSVDRTTLNSISLTLAGNDGRTDSMTWTMGWPLALTINNTAHAVTTRQMAKRTCQVPHQNFLSTENGVEPTTRPPRRGSGRSRGVGGVSPLHLFISN